MNEISMPSQSGFFPEDPRTVRLLPILHEMQSAFNDNPTAYGYGIFLGIFQST